MRCMTLWLKLTVIFKYCDTENLIFFFFPTKFWLVKVSHVWMWELDHKESWTPKNWYFWTVVLEKVLGSPLDCKEIQPVNLKGNQSWIFSPGWTDAEAETPILWPSDAKNWLIGKDPKAGKGWRQEEKRTREDEMFGWHHRFDGQEFEEDLGVGDGQGSLACCKESDTTEKLNWIELRIWLL